MKTIKNSIKLHGVIQSLNEVIKTRTGEEYQEFTLAVKRLSGAEDVLPVVINTKKVTESIRIGAEVTIMGTIKMDIDDPFGEETHLLMSVCVTTVVEEVGEHCNEVELEGPICKKPRMKTTPKGQTVCETMLMAAIGSNTPIPCIMWGVVAKNISSLDLYDNLKVHGRLQKRTYFKNTEQGREMRSFYEVSAFTAYCTRKRR